MREIIGQRLKERRISLNLTQAQIAEQTGLSTSQICYMESGKRSFSADILVSLSEILDCTADYLLKGSIPLNQPASVSKVRLPEHIVEMYLYLDNEEQEEIEILLEAKCRKKRRKAL